MENFKIRASMIGQIMTNPRSKSEKLSKTCITYLETWIKEQIYNRKKEFSSKYTDKGIQMEEDSLAFIAHQLNYGLLLKNEKHYSNDFITGTPDVVLSDLVIDVKNSWDPFTFPMFDKTVDKGYYWQAQGYLALTGKENYKLIYVLSDTPENIIQRECRSFAYKSGLEEVDEQIYQEFVAKMTYPDIEDKYKIKVFDISRDEEDIHSIKERVIECRNYINSEILPKL